MNDFLDDSSEEEFAEFQTSPVTGDLKALADLVKYADEIKAGIKKLEDRTGTGKTLLKNILEVEIPQLAANCGIGTKDSVTFGGITVTIQEDTYANVPSVSAIENEKDDNARAELKARRETGLAILESQAPSLIKRKYEISFERDEEGTEQAARVETMLGGMEDPPELIKGLSVHPKTLGKWITELRKEGRHFTDEEQWAFGIYPKKVAKISK